MTDVLSLTSRNLRVFFRDRASVFFSLLSAIILLLIYLGFLAELQVSQITEYFPGTARHEVYSFVITWVFAGIVSVTTISAALSGVSMFVDDRSTGRFADFMVSPVRRWQLTAGYLLSAFLVAVAMSVFTAIAGQLYLAVFGYPIMTIGQMALTVGYILLSAAMYAAVLCFVASFIRSTAAFSALGSIIGTAGGFLALAFIPAGLLPDRIADVLTALPFAQSAMLIRQPYTANALAELTGGQVDAVEVLSRFYGISAQVGDLTISVPLVVAVFALLIVVFAALASWRIRRSLRS